MLAKCGGGSGTAVFEAGHSNDNAWNRGIHSNYNVGSVNLGKRQASAFLFGAGIFLLQQSSLVYAQLNSPSFTLEQAARGKAVYDIQCATCHGEELAGAAFGPTLKGPGFLLKWRGKSLDGLFIQTVTTMPSAAPRSLGDQVYADILAYIAQINGVREGPTELPADAFIRK